MKNEKWNGKSASPPPFKKTFPCTILPPPFSKFSDSPSPLREVIKIYSPLGGVIVHSILWACCPMYLSKGLMIVYNVLFVRCRSCFLGFTIPDLVFQHSSVSCWFHVLSFLVLLHAGSAVLGFITYQKKVSKLTDRKSIWATFEGYH